MNKILTTFILLFMMVFSCFAEAENPIATAAKNFVIKDLSNDSYISLILTNDFKDDNDDQDKDSYLSKVRERRRITNRGILCVEKKNDKACLRYYYLGNEKKLNEIKTFSTSRMAKEAAKIRKMYESYKEDLKKEIASIKVIKVTEKDNQAQVSISLNEYDHGKIESKQVYSLTLKKIRKKWKIAKLNSIDTEL